MYVTGYVLAGLALAVVGEALMEKHEQLIATVVETMKSNTPYVKRCQCKLSKKGLRALSFISLGILLLVASLWFSIVEEDLSFGDCAYEWCVKALSVHVLIHTRPQPFI